MIFIKCPVCKALLHVDKKGFYYCKECPYKETHKDEKDRVFGRLGSQYNKEETKLHKTPYNTFREWEGGN